MDIRRFHEDESGLSALDSVMIVAIAAIVLAFVKLFWNEIKNWFAILIAPILGWDQ